MKRWAIIAASLFICSIGLLSTPSSRDAAAQAEAGWITLFDGKNLDNWSPIGTVNWKLEDGALVADNGNGFMVSKNDYKDFQLRVEFWVEDKTNSGVFIRCTDPNSVSGKTAYEVNIWDTRPERTSRLAGSIPACSSGGSGAWAYLTFVQKAPPCA